MNLRTIDAHVSGQPVRLIVDGFPAPRGKSMADRLDWANRHADGIRRVLMLEPRGHRDMCGAVLSEPASPGAHAGVLFMNNAGYVPLSGTGVVALTTIAIERALLVAGSGVGEIVFDTAAGAIRARPAIDSGAAGGPRVARVTYTNVPSFVIAAGIPIKIRGRMLRADVAFGGAFYAIVDSEAAGVGVSGMLAPELRRVGVEIKTAVEAARRVAHPIEPRLEGLEGVIFTAPPSEGGADLRSVTVFGDGAIDRSPGGNSTAALMAVLNAMDLLGDDGHFTHESIAGAPFVGSIASRTVVGDYEAIVPSIEASAWITGDHAFVVRDDDDMKEGFLL